MERIIKFRVWDNTQFSYFTVGQVWRSDWMTAVYHEHTLNGRSFQQFTGLLDKNGKEIYEGDFVQTDKWDYPFKVIFNQEKARFVFELKTGLTQHIYSECEVIGNIYENPELLKSLVS